MGKNEGKKMLAIGLAVGIAVGGLGVKMTKGPDSYGDAVVGKINNREIKRSEVLDEVLEKQVVSAYINDEVRKEYLKDMKVEPSEVEAQIEVYKLMVQGDWDEYLKEQMGGSEDFLRDRVELDLKEGKMLEKITASIEVTDEEVQDKFVHEGDSYKVLAGTVLYVPEDTDGKVRAEYEKGKTFAEIKKYMDDEGIMYEEKENENVSYDYEMFEKPVSEYKVGDLLVSSKDNDTQGMVILQAEKKSETIEDVRTQIENDIKNEKGYGEMNKQFTEFIEKTKIEVKGEKLN